MWGKAVALPRYFFPIFPTLNDDFLRFRTAHGSARSRATRAVSRAVFTNERLWNVRSVFKAQAVALPRCLALTATANNKFSIDCCVFASQRAIKRRKLCVRDVARAGLSVTDGILPQ